MQSLKDLRKASAVRQQLSRTGGDAAGSELTSSIELGEAPGGLAATTGAAGAAAGAPRVGRTLAPLTSAGSLVQATSRDDDPTSDGGTPRNKRDDAIQETRRRRRRRRRDREQQQRNDDSRGGVNEGDGATAVPGTSRISTAVAGEEEGSGFRGGGGFSGRSEGEETSRERATEEEKSATGPGPPLPLSARGLPPQERPQKKLTALEARRARIEQQKREETERTAGASGNSNENLHADASRMLSDSRGARDRPETTLQRRSDHSARASKTGGNDDDRSSGGYSDGSRREPGSNRTAARKGKDAPTRGTSDLTKEDEKGVAIGLGRETKEGRRDEGDEHSAEQDPLIPDTAAESRKPGDDKAEHIKSAGADAGIARGESSEPAGDDDGLEDTAEGGFKGMRSRMQKAGRGLMNKSPTFRRASSEEKARGARSKNTDDDQPEGGGGYNAEAAPDTAGVVDGAREVGGSTNNPNRASRSNLPPQNQEDSDTESNDSVMSPMMSEAEEEDDDGDDAERKGGKGRDKKKWQRKKAPAGEAKADGNTEAEVTLGHVVDRKMREMGYIRKPAVENLKNRRTLRDRVAAEGAPEVHFIGELSGAEGFGSGISCRFRVEGGRHWTCLAGLEEGQTHVIHADYGETFAPWNHPIDLHYTTKSIQGWPRLMLQVWQLDVHGRNVLRGYGFRHLPSTPGFSEVSVPCWRPTGTMQEETAAFFLGVTPRLTAEDAVFNRAWDQRCRLVTLPAGTVWIQISGLFRNFQDQGVDSLSFS